MGFEPMTLSIESISFADDVNTNTNKFYYLELGGVGEVRIAGDVLP